MMFAASTELVGELVFAAAAVIGLLIAVGSYFATNREVDKLAVRVTANEATSEAIRAELKQDKEDLIHAGERRSYTIHSRINPLVENTAAIKASNEAFVRSFDNFTEVMRTFAESSKAQTELLREILLKEREK
jgi:hypothetical protein